ncbi:MAG: molybdopterin dehydrogenase, partial [Candidatus Eisenbacteria bacterium]|nr:molybdopterin dehydrogenase [Candidatus Eisenbacteria bacterium]
PDITSAGPVAGLPDEPLHRPATLAEAITLLRRHPEECTFVAGATDLLTMLKLGTTPRGPLIDIAGLPEISRIEPTGGVIEIGAAVTFSSILDDPLIARHLPALRAAASLFGAVAIRNRATLGGNLASASPAADAPPVLAALGAAVVLAGPEGAREVPIESFFLGYRSTARRPDEMLVRVRVPLPEEGTRQAFFKVGTRRAQAIAKVSLACRARLDQGGVLRNVRLAAGSVAPTVLALARTQAALEGKTLTPGLIREAALIASFEVSPIDDVRSTARYRSTVTGRLLARFLEELHKP